MQRVKKEGEQYTVMVLGLLKMSRQREKKQEGQVESTM